MKKLFLGLALLAGTVAAQAAVPAPEAGKTYNIKNKCGLYMSYNGTKLTVANLDNGITDQRFTFEAVDGKADTYAIKAADGKYVGTDGQWTVAFASDATSDKFQVKFVESATEPDYVNLTFVSRTDGKGFGLDNTTAGSTIFTDKGESNNNFWTIEEAGIITSTVTPDPNKYYALRNRAGFYLTVRDKVQVTKKSETSFDVGNGATMQKLREGDKSQIMQFVPVEGKEGVYAMRVMSTGFYVASGYQSNKHTNYWTVTPVGINSALSQYKLSVAEGGEGYVFLSNISKKAGESYLGCDDNAENSSVYTNKDGQKLDRQTWWLEEVTLPKEVIDFSKFNNLVVNGDFQDPAYEQAQRLPEGEGSADELFKLSVLPGWNLTGGDHWGSTQHIVAGEGGVNHLVFQGYGAAGWDNTAAVNQDIDVAPFRNHVLKFDYQNTKGYGDKWTVKVTEKRKVKKEIKDDKGNVTAVVDAVENFVLATMSSAAADDAWKTAELTFKPISNKVTVELSYLVQKSSWRDDRIMRFNNVALYDVDPEDMYPDNVLDANDPRALAYDGYKLVFAEEFSSERDLNEIWNFEYGWKRNNEAQLYYKDKNCFVEDGVLVIEARDHTGENIPNPLYNKYGANDNIKSKYLKWTSGSMITKGGWQDGYSWLYGIYEVRAKIPQHVGCWPAIWTTGRQYSWPQGGEIDIMEYYGKCIHANVCYGNNVWNSATVNDNVLGEGWGDEFHTWRMVWEPDRIELWCDDMLVNFIDTDQTFNPVSEGKDWSGKNPFRDVRNILWLNLALGGNSGGSLTNTPRPSYYLIDYARIYQKVGTDGKATYHVEEEISEPAFKYKDGQKHPIHDAAGIEDITVDADDANAPVEYFNLQGIRVENPAEGNVYIRRQGSSAVKVVF